MTSVIDVLLVFLAIFLSLFAISIHELGHALKMRKYGVEIKEISLLGFGKVLFEFRLPFWFGDTPIYIKRILLGASVEPTEKGQEQIKALPYRAFADIYGAGIIANTAYIFLLFAFLGVAGAIRNFGSNSETTLSVLGIVAVLVVTAYLLWKGAHYVSAYLFPIFSIAIFFLVAYTILSISSFKEAQDAVGGPVGVVNIGTKVYDAYIGLASPIMTAGVVSFALGTTNLLPLIPLDGGHIILRIVRAVFPSRYGALEPYLQYSMVSLVLLLVGIALFSDISRIVLYIWGLLF